MLLSTACVLAFKTREIKKGPGDKDCLSDIPTKRKMLKYKNGTVSECPLYRVELYFHECRSEGPTHTQGTLEKLSEQSPAVVLQLLIQKRPLCCHY